MDKAEAFDLLYAYVADLAEGNLRIEDVVREAKSIMGRIKAEPIKDDDILL